jgi:flagellar biosynthesis protein
MTDEPNKKPEPPLRAVALRYAGAEQGSDHQAPSVTAKGRGEVAEKILAIARENGVPVREDKDLVALLSACDLGDEIPTELFTAVAELLTYLYRVNGELRS